MIHKDLWEYYESKYDQDVFRYRKLNILGQAIVEYIFNKHFDWEEASVNNMHWFPFLYYTTLDNYDDLGDNMLYHIIDELEEFIIDNKVDVEKPTFDQQELFIESFIQIVPLEKRITAYKNISLKANELRLERYRIQLAIKYQKLYE